MPGIAALSVPFGQRPPVFICEGNDRLPAIAAALAGTCEAVVRGRTPIFGHTRSGIDLAVEFAAADAGYEDLRLVGDARVVYQGKLSEEGLDWGGS